ncbi:MAG: pantoate--beta-alanine ligase [Candidatus Omnitrophica bacterium]|nr:pantoate--beta-alanine ligase [Candidatus Omnitrophota bacterium]
MFQIIRSARRMAATAERLRLRRKRIGFVPTMGALHEGHCSLIRAARAKNDVVIASLFVNPLQFGPHEDFRRYPRPFRKDAQMARAAGADVLFAPSAKELYPEGFQTSVEVEKLGRRWEGASRPGHFRGVATVVALLFEITRPTCAYFGQKDYQQALVIQRLIADLHLPIKMAILPTVREPDGLAMSSRNAYLTADQRRQATVLFEVLRWAQAEIRSGQRQAAPLIEGMRRRLSEAPAARIDYVAIVEPRHLEPVWRLRGRVALLLAVWIGATRLIDNLLVDVR